MIALKIAKNSSFHCIRCEYGGKPADVGTRKWANYYTFCPIASNLALSALTVAEGGLTAWCLGQPGHGMSQTPPLVSPIVPLRTFSARMVPTRLCPPTLDKLSATGVRDAGVCVCGDEYLSSASRGVRFVDGGCGATAVPAHNTERVCVLRFAFCVCGDSSFYPLVSRTN